MPHLLSAAYGPEPINYYGHAFLNRLSFLRENYSFLNKAVKHPSTQFLLLDNLSPPIVPADNSQNPPQDYKPPPFGARPAAHSLVLLDYAHVKPFIGEPFATPQDSAVAAWDSARDAIGASSTPLLVFLGLDESAASSFSFAHSNNCSYSGRPYFAVDISQAYLKSDALKRAAERLKTATPALHAAFQLRFNPFAIRLSLNESSLLAQARQYVDWNARNRFCGGCGAPTMSVNGGTKLLCPPTDAGAARPPCPTRGVISNLQFPRTDTSIIVAVVNHAGDKILLGRNRRFPAGFYSCLAGFLEPAETIEDCVRREVWEEAGVRVGRVVLYSSQPWPFPANIMVACVAQIADASDEAHAIHLGHDPELEDAKWYAFDELRDSFSASTLEGAVFGARPDSLPDGAPQLPPPEAVAWILIDAVLSGRVRGLSNSKI